MEKECKRATIRLHPDGKIDIHGQSKNLEVTLHRLAADPSIHSDNKELMKRFIDDCLIGKTVIGKRKKKICPATCLKHLHALGVLCRSISKSFYSVTQEDMEGFVRQLENNHLLKKNGMHYSDDTKASIKKTIKKFWKWKDGDNKAYPELVEWIDTYVSVRDVPALRREEVEKMIEYASGPRDKALIMVLFDSGARVEELLNVRLKKEHLFWKDDLKCYMIRLEYSKTKPRTISLPLSRSFVKSWLEIHPAKDNPQAQLFPMTYPALKMVIYRLGKKAVGKRVTPHILRHSSATYYANRLKNPYKLCYRYGWTMASDMVNRYLDREGIMEHETAELVKADEISAASKQNQRLTEELSLMKEAHSDLAAQFQRLQEKLQALESGKGILSLLIGLALKPGSQISQGLSGQSFDMVLPTSWPGIPNVATCYRSLFPLRPPEPMSGNASRTGKIRCKGLDRTDPWSLVSKL